MLWNSRKKVRITRKNFRNITNRRWDLTSYRSNRHWLPARFEYRIVIAWTPRLAITKLIVSEFSQAIISRFHWESCKNKFFFDIVCNQMVKNLLKPISQFYPFRTTWVGMVLYFGTVLVDSVTSSITILYGPYNMVYLINFMTYCNFISSKLLILRSLRSEFWMALAKDKIERSFGIFVVNRLKKSQTSYSYIYFGEEEILFLNIFLLTVLFTNPIRLFVGHPA